MTDDPLGIEAHLAAPVAPLQPGETVTIPSALPGTVPLCVTVTDRGLLFVGPPAYGAHVDADGVRALRLACDRFLATLP